MVRRWECQRIASTSSAALADEILIENAVSGFCSGFPATLKTFSKVANNLALTHLLRVCYFLFPFTSMFIFRHLLEKMTFE